MLENLTKRLSQFVVGALVLLLGVVMALQFGGPQAEGCTSGGATYAAQVHGRTISEGDFRAAYALAGFDRYPPEVAEQNQLREHIMNGLVERSLLAHEARDVGFHTTQDDVWDKLIEDGTVYLSVGISAPETMPSGEVPVPVRDRDGEFDSESAKRFIQYGLRRSVAEFADAQMEEMLAQRMRELVLSTVDVSPREVWDAYVGEREQASLEYVRYAPAFYRDRVDPTEAEVAEWAAENEERVQQEYEANRHRYTGLDPQIRPAHILVEVSEDASDEVKQAAREKADGYLRRLRAGDDFAQLARQVSEDVHSGRRGGDLGWTPRGRMPADLEAAAFALEEGAFSDVVETSRGFHVITVLGKREGDVPEAEAKQEIAERLYRDSRAEEIARREAEQALAALAGGTTIEELDRRLRRQAAGMPEQPAQPVEPTEGEEGEEEELPEPTDPLAPRVESTRSFGRTGQPLATSYDSTPLARAAFELSEEDPLPEEPLQMGSDFYVFRLSTIELATEEGFTDEINARIRQGLRAAKEREALRVYLHRLRARAVADGDLRVNEQVLRYTDETEEGEEPAEEEEAEPAEEEASG
jgi:peptidyl-prolyl cis-trans isomerase D